MGKLVIGLLLSCLVVACATQETKAPDIGAEPAPYSAAIGHTTQPPEIGAELAPTLLDFSNISATDELNDPSNILAKRSIHYPFDVSEVQRADLPLVQAHAKYLSEHPDRKVRLEGNCDERGAEEYNLALGQLRAEKLKKMLRAGGANEKQIEAVSFGAEKPRATGHDEASWAQNRRTDLKY